MLPSVYNRDAYIFISLCMARGHCSQWEYCFECPPSYVGVMASTGQPTANMERRLWSWDRQAGLSVRKARTWFCPPQRTYHLLSCPMTSLIWSSHTTPSLPTARAVQSSFCPHVKAQKSRDAVSLALLTRGMKAELPTTKFWLTRISVRGLMETAVLRICCVVLTWDPRKQSWVPWGEASP